MRGRLLSQTAAAVIILITIGCFAGCAPSRENQLKARLEAFKTILPEQVRVDFDNKKFDDVVKQVDSLLIADPAFKNNWDDIKAAEAINLFTTQEVIDYFEKYFVNYRERR